MRHVLWNEKRQDLAHAIDGAIVGFTAAVIAATLCLCGCPSSQPADDAQHGFEHTLALSTCGQQARQAATDATNAMDSSADAEAVKHARRVAALAAFDACADKMKDGGI